jgi:hypothetical protein
LHDDGDGDAGSLDGDIIKIIRDGYTEHAEGEALDEIGLGELDALPSATADQDGQQDKQRECGAGLGENERVDWVNCFAGQRKFSREDGAAESGGDSPEKCGGGDE